jgi:ABC-type dipeptide/oligopeptide/nickel transport system ATPase subunit
LPRLVHSQFVLLAFFLDPDPEVREFLRSYLRIESLESVLFVVRRPRWANSRRGDPRFWGAVGIVRDFLDRLYGAALAPLRLNSGRRNERLYLFVKDQEALAELFSPYGALSNCFKTLESTYLSELIAEVRIRVHVRGMLEPLTFRELSEGEQQLLTVLGLLRFTREEESLFLLDEPDTHLNPTWSLEYLELLKRVVGERETSHLVIATHDPVMISGLYKEQVQVLYRDGDSGDVLAKQADEDPQGMGVAALLTSELFGLRSSVDLETLRKLDHKRELAARGPGNLSPDEQGELEQLSAELGNLDFTRTVRDPLYSEFVRAMEQSGAYQELKAPSLTMEERLEQRELSQRVLRQLLEDREE